MPSVKILNIGKDAVSPSLITRSENTYFEASVNFNQYLNKGGQLQWKIRSMIFFPPNISTNSVVVDLGSSQWNVERLSLKVGLYMVECRVKFASNLGFSSQDFGVLKVSPSPLVAFIDGGTEVLRSVNNLLKLDGFMSRDPDVVNGGEIGMQFIWFCRNKGVTSNDIFNVTRKTTFLAARGSTFDNQRCFRTNNEQLLENGTVVDIAGNSLDVDHSYNFELQVEKDKRSSNFIQTVYVVSGNAPQISIR